jgi:hypothetical protein
MDIGITGRRSLLGATAHEVARLLLTLPDTPIMLVGAHGKTQPLADIVNAGNIHLRATQQVTHDATALPDSYCRTHDLYNCPYAHVRDASCGWGHGNHCPCQA